jgi:hypothetical protein
VVDKLICLYNRLVDKPSDVQKRLEQAISKHKKHCNIIPLVFSTIRMQQLDREDCDSIPSCDLFEISSEKVVQMICLKYFYISQT